MQYRYFTTVKTELCILVLQSITGFYQKIRKLKGCEILNDDCCPKTLFGKLGAKNVDQSVSNSPNCSELDVYFKDIFETLIMNALAQARQLYSRIPNIFSIDVRNLDALIWINRSQLWNYIYLSREPQRVSKKQTPIINFNWLGKVHTDTYLSVDNRRWRVSKICDYFFR